MAYRTYLRSSAGEQGRDEKEMQLKIGLATLLTVVFSILKLCKVIDWPWIWVVSPIWISLALWLAIMVCIVVCIIALKIWW